MWRLSCPRRAPLPMWSQQGTALLRNLNEGIWADSLLQLNPKIYSFGQQQQQQLPSPRSSDCKVSTLLWFCLLDFSLNWIKTWSGIFFRHLQTSDWALACLCSCENSLFSAYRSTLPTGISSLYKSLISVWHVFSQITSLCDDLYVWISMLALYFILLYAFYLCSFHVLSDDPFLYHCPWWNITFIFSCFLQFL